MLGRNRQSKARRFSSGQVAPVSSNRFTRKELKELFRSKATKENVRALRHTGGVKEVARRLGVEIIVGLTSEEAEAGFPDRVKQYGSNKYPELPIQSFGSLFYDALQDLILVTLILAAIAQGIIGYIQEPVYGWADGMATLIAVVIIGLVTAANDYSKERQFRVLNAVKEAVDVAVLRDGKMTMVPSVEVQVGEVLILESGDKVRADCVYVSGYGVKSNEVSLTGEPDEMTKDLHNDPFLYSGCHVTAGSCRALVIAVGKNSRWGRAKNLLLPQQEDTPLQQKLDGLAKLIGKFGTGAGVTITLAMLAMFGINAEQGLYKGVDFTNWLLQSIIVCITIIVVAVPEGLPLAVTIALAYSTGKMLSDQNLVRELAACETMGTATNICTDKTGTLTKNRMSVVEGWFGGLRHTQDMGMLPDAAALPEDLARELGESIAVNTTATLQMKKGDRRPTVLGSQTEGALLAMIERWELDFLSLREQASIKRFYTFSSDRKLMSVLVAKPDGSYRLFVKGASEIVLRRSTRLVELGGVRDIEEADRDWIAGMISGMAHNALRTIAIAFRDFTTADLPDNWGEEPPEMGLTLQAIVGIMDPVRDEVVEAVRSCQRAGIMVRMVTGDNIDTATTVARQCGILTSGGVAMEGSEFRALAPKDLDDLLPNLQVVARASPSDKHTLVMRLNGEKLPKDEASWREMHPGLDFEDMKDLVLPGYIDEWKEARYETAGAGEVVGVTGDGTNDAPALKAGNVGLSMGSGTEVAKEASDIVIMDDDFTSIVQSVLWGRSVYQNVRKFLQFQLTVNIVASLFTFVAVVLENDPPLNPVMLLWVNLVMDTMGALALSTEEPVVDLLSSKPYSRKASLVDTTMWRNILVQVVLQLGILLAMLAAGGSVVDEDTSLITYEGFLGVDVVDGGTKPCQGGPINRIDGKCKGALEDFTHYTMIFNTFVFFQLFNEFNARRINSEWNVWRGVHRNRMFVAMIVVGICVQIAIVELGARFTKTTGLTMQQWGVSIGFAATTIPVGVAMRFIPTEDNPNDFCGYDDPQTKGEGAAVDVARGTSTKTGAADVHDTEAAGSAPVVPKLAL